MMDTLIFLLMFAFTLASALCLALALRAAYRFYRDYKPRNPMARARGLPKPSKDATRYMRPGSL